MEWELAYDDVFVYWHEQSRVAQTCNSEPHFSRIWQNIREFQGVRMKKRNRKTNKQKLYCESGNTQMVHKEVIWWLDCIV